MYPETSTVKECLERLKVMLVGLKWHIYTAPRQWTGHEVHRSNLNPISVITIEDYQMNLEVVYRENPTSLAYSTNKKTVALYPICVEFLNEHGQLCKGLQCRTNQVCSECQKLKGRDKSHIKVNEEEGEEESEVEAEEDYGPGDIVWALYGRRWYSG